MIIAVETESQPKEVKEDLSYLKALLADLLENQSSPRLNDAQKRQCRFGIRAIRRSIEAIECQILA